MSAVLWVIVQLVAWLLLVWSMGMVLRLRRENAELKALNERLRTAVIEATGALNARAERGASMVRRHQRDRALRGLPAVIFGDAEGLN